MTEPSRTAAPGCPTHTNGRVEYRDHRGELHRVDGPAVTYPDGTETWFHHGILHREDGPARTFSDGRTEWWVNGNRRLDLEQLIAAQPEPTRTEWPDGTIEYRNAEDERHRLNGPAFTRPDGTELWYLHGRLHRTDGPAVTYPDGRTQWWINGKRRKDIEETLATLKYDPTETTPSRQELPDGTVEYYDTTNGRLHRLDGPALTAPDGTQYWYSRGVFHRVDGPAIAYPNGAESWYLDGLRHRLDGPARTLDDGSTEWWVNGERRPDLEQEANKDA